MPLQIGQLCKTLIAYLAYKWTCNEMIRTFKLATGPSQVIIHVVILTVASVSLGVLPHGTVTGELLAADLALELVLRQMFGAMLLHLLHGIEALLDCYLRCTRNSHVRVKEHKIKRKHI